MNSELRNYIKTYFDQIIKHGDFSELLDEDWFEQWACSVVEDSQLDLTHCGELMETDEEGEYDDIVDSYLIQLEELLRLSMALTEKYQRKLFAPEGVSGTIVCHAKDAESDIEDLPNEWYEDFSSIETPYSDWTFIDAISNHSDCIDELLIELSDYVQEEELSLPQYIEFCKLIYASDDILTYFSMGYPAKQLSTIIEHLLNITPLTVKSPFIDILEACDKACLSLWQ